MQPVKLDILSDPICPWCYIGKARLDRAMEQRPGNPFVIEWHPFQLNPEMPVGGMDRRSYMESKFGGQQGAVKAYLPVQQHAEAKKYGVVRELVGHGVGIELHEAPEVPNYGRRGSGMLLQEGMVLAIEPMINLGTKNVRQAKDGWTIVTSDNKPSAHFEHTVYVGKEQVQVLSSFEEVFKALAEKK